VVANKKALRLSMSKKPFSTSSALTSAPALKVFHYCEERKRRSLLRIRTGYYFVYREVSAPKFPRSLTANTLDEVVRQNASAEYLYPL
jgi:hypothetical protein